MAIVVSEVRELAMGRERKTQIFKGKTYTEALVKAKSKLGKDFDIVERRDVRQGTLFSNLLSGRLGGGNLSVELEVSPMKPGEEPAEPKQADAPVNPLMRSYAKALEGAEKHSPKAIQAMAAAAAPFASLGETAGGIAGKLEEITKTIERTRQANDLLREELVAMLSLQARGGLPAVSPRLLESYRRLADGDVSEALAREIVMEIQDGNPGTLDGDDLREALVRAVARRIPVAAPVLAAEGRPTVVALVGASGVGKSTSLVKLAIQHVMLGGKRVGVINEDLRRPGAEGQINNLGRMFGISVTTAASAGEIANVVKSMSGRDIILIDTSGRSPRDEGGIRRLDEILRTAGVDEIHLLLSGVSSERTMRETVLRYRPLGFDRIIMTKLDECVSFGCLANVGAWLETGLSYVTTGPDYTKPIEAADSRRLAELVLGLREIDVEQDVPVAEGGSV